MNENCALCVTPLTSMDTLLGENKLSDGGILCNKCLNKATNINKDLVYDLINYSLAQVREVILGDGIQEPEIEEERKDEYVKEVSISRTVVTFSHSTQSNIVREEPTRLDEIKDQIVALNAKLSIFVNREVSELVNVLDKNERIIAIAEGKYLYNNLEGILVSTERRVIFVDKKFFGGVFENEFPHYKINSMQHSFGLISSELKIFTDGVKAEFKLYNRNAAKTFYEAIHGYIYNIQNKSREQQQAPPVQQPQKPKEKSVRKEDTGTIFEKLEKLGRLRETGVLTDEEFAEQKKKLLDKL